jgi:transposase-like protein
MSKKGSRYRKHSQEFKLGVLKRHLKDGVSVDLLAQEYQLELKLIRTWRTLFVNHGENGLKPKPKPKGRPKGTPAMGRSKNGHNPDLKIKHPFRIEMSALNVRF